MAKSSSGSPFGEIAKKYQEYFSKLSPDLALLVRAFILILIAVVGGMFLLSLGLFAF